MLGNPQLCVFSGSENLDPGFRRVVLLDFVHKCSVPTQTLWA